MAEGKTYSDAYEEPLDRDAGIIDPKEKEFSFRFY
jgi:hypothetical protein